MFGDGRETKRAPLRLNWHFQMTKKALRIFASGQRRYQRGEAGGVLNRMNNSSCFPFALMKLNGIVTMV